MHVETLQRGLRQNVGVRDALSPQLPMLFRVTKQEKSYLNRNKMENKHEHASVRAYSDQLLHAGFVPYAH